MAYTRMIHTCASFGCDCTQLDADRMLALLKVLQTMPVPADTAKLLASAPERAACQAEPQIFLQLALPAMRQTYPPFHEPYS